MHPPGNNDNNKNGNLEQKKNTGRTPVGQASD